MQDYIYSLRICICPGFQEEEKFQQLLKFCQEAQIDDVQFFTNSEEINQGHPTKEEVQRWLDMIKRFQPRLKETGVTVSLNPWTTTLHADRGRILKEGQNFTTMADINGESAKAASCPLDENFQYYIKEIFSLYASADFDTIWIEDDFRLHNHVPLEWGGCFCELHMKKFSEKAGRKLERQKFVEGIIKEGTPHEYRKIWLDTARDTMNDFAKLLGDAVHEKNPETRVGLMSSAPQSHCIEGRDWKMILENLSGDTRPLNRPHLPAYDENASQQYALNFQKISRLSAAITKGQAQLLPELDNLPHTTFSKSHKFAKMEIESTLALCAEGITINIFDMIGNGINWKQRNEKMLSEIKPYLNAVRRLELQGNQERGICVMYSEKSSYTIHTCDSKGMEAIQPWETFWAEYLSVFGIAYRYCDDIHVKGEIVAVSGQFFRNYSELEIENLFANNVVILEGEAADTLVDMGMGSLIHVAECYWHKLNCGYQSFEQIVDGNLYQGLREARISAQGMSETVETGDYLEIIYDKEPERVFTVLKSPEEKTVGNGLVQLEEDKIIFPYGHMRNMYHFLLNPVRQELFFKIAASSRKYGFPVMVKNCQYVTVNHFEQKEKHVLFLMNYSSDDFENIELQIPFEVSRIYEVNRRTGECERISYEKHGETLVLSITLESMTSRCIMCV